MVTTIYFYIELLMMQKKCKYCFVRNYQFAYILVFRDDFINYFSISCVPHSCNPVNKNYIVMKNYKKASTIPIFLSMCHNCVFTKIIDKTDVFLTLIKLFVLMLCNNRGSDRQIKKNSTFENY